MFNYDKSVVHDFIVFFFNLRRAFMSFLITEVQTINLIINYPLGLKVFVLFKTLNTFTFIVVIVEHIYRGYSPC